MKTEASCFKQRMVTDERVKRQTVPSIASNRKKITKHTTVHRFGATELLLAAFAEAVVG